uniref:Lens intrinsic membrane protein 2 n=1 Tax=Nomascus leucogenys TaxID=61853 RepID=G1R1R5_NOMLE
MYSFMGGGLFCAWVGTILLVVATATDHWMQYRLSGSFAHQGLWRYCLGNKCYLQTDSIGEPPGQSPGRAWGKSRADLRAQGHLYSRWRTLRLKEGKGATQAYWNATRPTFSRISRPFSAGIMFFSSTLFVLLALAIYTGVTVSFLGRRFGDWRFSWSYILGWVAVLMTFFAGIFYICAYRVQECRRLSTPR